VSIWGTINLASCLQLDTLSFAILSSWPGKTHYQLRTLEVLFAYIERGGILKYQDDVSNAIREEFFLEEQQISVGLQFKSNKMLALGNCPPININFIGGQSHL
jgi:hypothetical protein